MGEKVTSDVISALFFESFDIIFSLVTTATDLISWVKWAFLYQFRGKIFSSVSIDKVLCS